ncbi:MAG: LPS assembly lipoprotein LptE [Steroidobacteraceae bacterium]
MMRQLLRYCLIGFVTLAAGCGFQLRGQAPLPAVFATPYLESSDRYTPLYAALESRLRAAGARPAVDKLSASAVIHLDQDETGRALLSVSARNTPGEFEVYYTAGYSVTAGGSELLARQQVTLTRDFGYDETAVLAKEHEEQSLRAALADELAGMILRRLAAL